MDFEEKNERVLKPILGNHENTFRRR